MEKHTGSKYVRLIHSVCEGKKLIHVDVYSVLEAFNVTCPARAHAIKKLLCAGLRGKGDAVQDLKETVDAIRRAIELEEKRLEDFIMGRAIPPNRTVIRIDAGACEPGYAPTLMTEHTEAAKDKVAVCPLCEQGHKPTRTSKQAETPNFQEVDYQKAETKIGAAVATDIAAMKFDAAVMKSAMLFSESKKKKQQYKDTAAPEPTENVWINVLRKKRAQLAVIADWSLAAGLGSICAYIRPALRSLDNEIVRLEKLLEPKPPVGDLQHGTGADPRTAISEDGGGV